VTDTYTADTVKLIHVQVKHGAQQTRSENAHNVQ